MRTLEVPQDLSMPCILSGSGPSGVSSRPSRVASKKGLDKVYTRGGRREMVGIQGAQGSGQSQTVWQYCVSRIAATATGVY